MRLLLASLLLCVAAIAGNLNFFCANKAGPPAPPPFTDLHSADLTPVGARLDCGTAINPTIATAFSIGLWYNPQGAIPSISTFMSNNEGAAGADGAYRGVWLRNQASTTTLYLFSDFTGGSYLYKGGPQVLTANVWSHIVATYDGSNTQSGMFIYVNGVDVTAGTLGFGAGPITSNQPWSIGSDQSNLYQATGYIDDAFYINRVLTPTEVANIYGAGVPTSLFSYSMPAAWYFENAFTDSGTGGNTCTAVGGATFTASHP